MKVCENMWKYVKIGENRWKIGENREFCVKKAKCGQKSLNWAIFGLFFHVFYQKIEQKGPKYWSRPQHSEVFWSGTQFWTKQWPVLLVRVAYWCWGVPKSVPRGVCICHVHRGWGYPMYMASTYPPRHRFGVFCLFSVLWYTFRGSKKVFATAQTVWILTEEPARRQKKRYFWTVCNIFCPRFVASRTL